MHEIDFKEFLGEKTEENRIENFIKKFKKPLKVINYIFKIFVIIIVLFLIIEFFSFISLFVYNKLHNEPEIFEDKEEYHEFSKEFGEAFIMEYSPYIIYKKLPNYHGKYINLNNESLRETTRCPLSNPIKIFVFGGSTTWGERVNDDETIPSFLSKYLCEKNIPVEVTNFGEEGYVNTQEMIRLLLELKKEKNPDIVIFYDGINDVIATGQSEAGMPQNLEGRKKDYGSRNKLNLINFLSEHSKFMKIIEGIKRRTNLEPKESKNKEVQANEIISVLLENQKIIKSLEKDYGFKTFFYWQPILYTKSNKSDSEKEILEFHYIYKYYGGLYLATTEKIKNKDEFMDVSRIFNDYNKTIYFDVIHVFKEGNEIIAKRIGEDIINYLNA